MHKKATEGIKKLAKNWISNEHLMNLIEPNMFCVSKFIISSFKIILEFINKKNKDGCVSPFRVTALTN